MIHPIALSIACQGFIRHKPAEGKSTHTIADYQTTFKKVLPFFGEETPLGTIGVDRLSEFLAWLQEKYVSSQPGVAARGVHRLSPKSILNIHTNLSALWAWAVQEGYAESNFVRRIKAPITSPTSIEPLTKDEVATLLKACATSAPWQGRSSVAAHRRTCDREGAIILTLLDTGIRASELCGIQYKDVNIATSSIKVRGKGPGRVGKERIVHIGKRASQAIWKSTLPRVESIRDTDPLFIVGSNLLATPMTRTVLRRLLKRLGDKAGVSGVYPHRFRHTFAITYLRNRGDIFTLQSLLGHSDLAMVRRYVRIAQVDCAEAHGRASPVDNWSL